MSVFTDVKDLAGGKKKSKDWYREQLMFGLQDYTGGFKPGDIIFFNYAAATEKLLFWDTYPMVIISRSDINTGHFEGGNLHYLRPSARKSIAGTWSAGGLAYPTRCHHKYFMSNATNIKAVRPIDLQNMTPLPVEQFVLRSMGRVIEVPSSFIWSRV